MIKIRYKIAGIIIEIHSPRPIKITEKFQPFLLEHEEEASDWLIDIQEVDELPEVAGVKIISNLNYSIFRNSKGKFIKMFHDHLRDDFPYAVSYREDATRNIRIQCLKEEYRFLADAENSFFHIGWEAILIQEKNILLHASCIDTAIGGILFTGPSGIGKSTQAELWRIYQNAELINGDRVIISKEDTKWKAHGSPYAGSSKCYVNKSCNIRGIVVLKQAKSCSIRKMGILEAFRTIFSGLTVNSWDEAFVSMACELAQKLVMEVPVYELSCTPEKEAVNLLYEAMMQGGKS